VPRRLPTILTVPVRRRRKDIPVSGIDAYSGVLGDVCWPRDLGTEGRVVSLLAVHDRPGDEQENRTRSHKHLRDRDCTHRAPLLMAAFAYRHNGLWLTCGRRY
jgi:hypothetical protein